MADAKTTAKRSSTTKASGNVWSKEERAAVQETARERKKSAKLSPEEERAEGEADVQAKIAGMPADDRAIRSDCTDSHVRIASSILTVSSCLGIPHPTADR